MLVDGAVVEWIKREVLTEEFVNAAMAEVRRRIAARAEASQDELDRLAAQAEKLRAEVDKLAELALEAPKDTRPVFFAKMGERQAELTVIDTRLRAAATVPKAMEMELRRMEAEARRRIVELHDLMERNPSEAKAFARSLFPDGLKTTSLSTPDGRRMRLEGVAAPDRALGLEVGNSASPAGHARWCTRRRGAYRPVCMGSGCRGGCGRAREVRYINRHRPTLGRPGWTQGTGRLRAHRQPVMSSLSRPRHSRLAEQ